MVVVTKTPQGRVVGADRVLAAADRWTTSMGAATAVYAPNGILTFSQAVDHMRLLAALLVAEGTGPGTPVGLFLGGSRLAVSNLLTVWSLGATAVPMDGRHPTDRINSELRDAGVRVVLADRLPAGVGPPRARQIHPKDAFAGKEVPAAIDRSAVSHPEDCIYVIYTSGTTDWPKASR